MGKGHRPLCPLQVHHSPQASTCSPVGKPSQYPPVLLYGGFLTKPRLIKALAIGDWFNLQCFFGWFSWQPAPSWMEFKSHLMKLTKKNALGNSRHFRSSARNKDEHHINISYYKSLYHVLPLGYLKTSHLSLVALTVFWEFLSMWYALTLRIRNLELRCQLYQIWDVWPWARHSIPWDSVSSKFVGRILLLKKKKKRCACSMCQALGEALGVCW